MDRVLPQDVTVALVGVGGYGEVYASAMLHDGQRYGVRFVAGVDVISQSPAVANLQAAGIPVYESVAKMYQVHQPDLVVVASPIQHHCNQVVASLEMGSHVLCEKPVAATVEQALAMLQARTRAKKTVAIGYQWSFCPVINSIKRDIATGLFGRPLRFRTIVLWPRNRRYFRRNNWAGRERDEFGGQVFDGPANNACAHFLHNMLFLLGDRTDTSAHVASVQAELYRANEIESYDTVAIRCHTIKNVELHFVASHATEYSVGPLFSYEFENATIAYAEIPGADITATFKDGTTKSYGKPAHANDPSKLWMTVEAIRNGAAVPCGIETALPHATTVAAARLSSGGVHEFPQDAKIILEANGKPYVVVKDLGEQLMACHHQGLLPAEQGVPWAVATPAVLSDTLDRVNVTVHSRTALKRGAKPAPIDGR